MKIEVLVDRLQVPGNPVCLELLNRVGGYSGEEVVYGTSDGQIGVITLGRGSPDHGWSHSNDLGRGGVTCIDFYKICGPEEPDFMLIGRDDGYVEVFAVSDFEDPKMVYSFMSYESITGIRGLSRSLLYQLGKSVLNCNSMFRWSS